MAALGGGDAKAFRRAEQGANARPLYQVLSACEPRPRVLVGLPHAGAWMG
jgi:hypothetical protein